MTARRITDLQILTPDQIASYDAQGFLVLRGMYNAREIADVCTWIDELSAMEPQPGGQAAYFEDSLVDTGRRVLTRIENFAEVHERFGDFVRSTKLIGSVSELFREPAILFKEKVNFKMPGGHAFTPHQDIQGNWDAFGTDYMSVMVTIDENTVENGCLEVAAGHHVKGRLAKDFEPLPPDVLEGMQFEHVPTMPGDAICFNVYAPHQSGPNMTDQPRRNLYMTYNPASQGDHREAYFVEKRRNLPPDNERDPNKTYEFKV